MTTTARPTPFTLLTARQAILSVHRARRARGFRPAPSVEQLVKAADLLHAVWETGEAMGVHPAVWADSGNLPMLCLDAIREQEFGGGGAGG